MQPDGRRDTETDVAWLQGRTFFGDLRQPPGRPDMTGAAAIADLSAEQCAWLATQEGFAGALAEDADCVVWTRRLDFQPPSSGADAGRLRMEAGLLVEEGRDVAYVEHWAREAEPPATDCWGASLTGADGAQAWVVRAGGTFMFARARPQPLPPDARLPDLVRAAASVAEMQALVDCEVSLGRVEGGAWRVGRSTLPFRVGRAFAIAADGGSLTLVEDGVRRSWRIEALEGDPITA